MRQCWVMEGEAMLGGRVGETENFLYIKKQRISILDFVDSALIIVLYIMTKNTIMTTSSVYERNI